MFRYTLVDLRDSRYWPDWDKGPWIRCEACNRHVRPDDIWYSERLHSDLCFRCFNESLEDLPVQYQQRVSRRNPSRRRGLRFWLLF